MQVTRQSNTDDAPQDARPSAKLLICFLLCFYAVWALRATLLFTIDGHIHSDSLRLVYAILVKFVLWVIPAVVYLRATSTEPPFKYLKLTSTVNKKGLILGLILSLVFFTLMVLFEGVTSGKNLKSLAEAAPGEWLRVFLTVSPSSVWEEIFFRGFLLNQLNERIVFWKANLLTAILFALIHWPNWIWVNGFQAWIPATTVAIIILALFLGYLMRLTNSLWPSIAAHIVNNFLAHFLRV